MDAQLEAFPGLIERLLDSPAVSGELVLLALEDRIRLADGIEDERLFLFELLLALPHVEDALLDRFPDRFRPGPGELLNPRFHALLNGSAPRFKAAKRFPEIADVMGDPLPALCLKLPEVLAV